MSKCYVLAKTLLFFNRKINMIRSNITNYATYDLKVGKLMHQDIGQMQMYINYYERELNVSGDNPPIGIILCADKNEAVVKYTINENNKQIFTSKYKLELPTEDELKIELLREKAEILLYQHLNENNQLDDKTDE